MPANPCSKWFWNDWDNDIALHLCSLAAQGLWMRMLSIAARATPIGYVMVNGRSVDATDLAHVTGASEAEIRCLLDELEDRRVFSRDRHHRIYNRRMVRDDRAHHQSVRDGKKGGNPLLLQAAENKRQNPEGLTNNIRPPLDPFTLSPSPPLESPKGLSRQSGEQIAAQMLEIWNRECGDIGLRRAMHPDKPNKRRVSACNARFKEHFGSDMEQWSAFVRRVVASSFLAGNSSRGFQATLDWVLTPMNATKILEGNYDDRTGPAAKPNGHSSLYDGPTEPPPGFEDGWVPVDRPH